MSAIPLADVRQNAQTRYTSARLIRNERSTRRRRHLHSIGASHSHSCGFHDVSRYRIALAADHRSNWKSCTRNRAAASTRNSDAVRRIHLRHTDARYQGPTGVSGHADQSESRAHPSVLRNCDISASEIIALDKQFASHCYGNALRETITVVEHTGGKEDSCAKSQAWGGRCAHVPLSLRAALCERIYNPHAVNHLAGIQVFTVNRRAAA